MSRKWQINRYQDQLGAFIGMVGARSVIKLSVPLLLLATMLSASVEARRAYQTIENQDDTQVTDTVDGPIVVVVPVKHQAQSKQDKSTHQTSILTKIVTEKKEQSVRSNQFLSSPLDCMIQYEKEHHAGLESQSILKREVKNEQPEAASVIPATARENIVRNNTDKKNRSSDVPIDIAVTAVAIGICCYSFSRKFLFKQRKTMIGTGRNSSKAELNLKA